MTALASDIRSDSTSPVAERVNGVHAEWLRMPAFAEPFVKHFTLTPQDVAEPAAKTVAATKLDADLERAAKHAGWMRQGFYVAVLGTALAGQVTGATERLHIPLLAAVPAVAVLELGGVVVMTNADVRRRLGESAIGSRILSALIAAWAVAFNWLAHKDHLLGGFFAGMSALGYLVWMMHVENQRRDRLRAIGDLPAVPPKYELWSHWLMHPGVTLRARTLAKESQSPGRTPLDLYASLDAARSAIVQARRTRALSAVIGRQVRASGRTPSEAEIALTTYDLNEVAERVQDHADYARLAELIAAQIHPDAVAGRGASETAKTQVIEGVSAFADAVPDAPETHLNAPSETQSGASVQTHFELVSDAPAEPRRARPATVAKAHSGMRSADAKAVAQVRALARRAGGTPSVRRVMTELNVGAPKAKEYLRLAAESSDTEETS